MSIANNRDFEQLKSKLPIKSFLIKYLPDGKQQGNEWVALNPTRPDNSLGSFKINLDTGVWADFATGDKGSDLIALYAYLQGCNQAKAYDDLSAIYHNQVPVAPQQKKQPRQYDCMEDFPPAEGLWVYYDYDGQFLGYVIRLLKRDKNGKKIFNPFIPHTNNKWLGAWWPCIFKPIYRADQLKLYPKKSVLIVEGEKAADAAQLLFPEYVCVAWMGGSGNADKADITHLKDRICFLWPDNDAEGEKAMKTLYSRLFNHASNVQILNIKSLPISEKWDLADYKQEQFPINLLRDLFLKQNNQIQKTIPKDEFPIRSLKGNPINTYENIEYLCSFYNLNPKFNVINKEIIMDMSYKNFTNANKAKLEFAELKSLCIKNNVPICDLVEWLTMVADKNAFNPVEQYIMSKPWDGISRIQEFIQTIDCHDNAARDIYIYRWMIGAVAVGLSSAGLSHPGVLSFIGNQAKGKSSWFSKLVPEELNLTVGEFILNPDDKDSVIIATKYWLVELAEIDATVNRSSPSTQKAFLTRKVDLYRSPYDRTYTEAPRHTAFVGTVNDSQFLKDETGNRRFWVLDVKSINYEHTIDMQQVWAEFKVLYDQGIQYHLTKSELETLMVQNEEYRVISSVEETIRLSYRWDLPERNRKMTALQVLSDCGFDVSQEKLKNSKEATRILRKLTGSNSKKSDGLFYFYLPPSSGFRQ